MKIFLDTSSLIKLYHSEKGTENLDKLFDEYAIEEIYLCDISKIEFNSAIWKKVRTKELNEDIANELIKSFEADYDNYSFIEISSELIENARDLVNKYGSKGLRTLDSFQLSSSLKVKNEISFAISADDLLMRLIELEGIKTK
jgi:predicted nucleic acid-binding protein